MKSKLSAKEFWKFHFNEYPQNDAEKLAVTMMAEYAGYREQFQQPVKDVGVGEWQLCPKCNGEGKYYTSMGTPGLTTYNIGWLTCPVCLGAKVLARPLLNSESTEPVKQG